MTSTIINFIVEKYLANILEIDTAQTQSSMWNGTVEMQNLKIKPEIFDTLNLPYFELVNGYVGHLKIKITLPIFYHNPIKVFIDKVFFHARQKSLNKLDTKEEIQAMEQYKNSKLQTMEELNSQVNALSNEESTMSQQIINNLQINIEEVVIRFEDTISYPVCPYVFGAILKQVLIRSTTEKYEDEESEETIPLGEIIHKLIKVKDFSIFMDLKEKPEQVDFTSGIVAEEKNKIGKNLAQYLKNSLDFYAYAMSEVNCHSLDEKSHCYLLYNMSVTLKLGLNSNLKNLFPKIVVALEVSKVQMSISLTQFSTLLKVLAYVKLNTYYRAGIYKEYYHRQLTESEQKSYVNTYCNYYKAKYNKSTLNEEEAVKWKAALECLEVRLTYEQVQLMRQASEIRLTNIVIPLEEIEKRLEYLHNRTFIGSYFYQNYDEAEENEILAKKAKIVASEGEINKRIQEQLMQNKPREIEENADLDDNFILYAVKLTMGKNVITLLEGEGLPLIELALEDFEIKANIGKSNMLVSVFLGDFCVQQYILEDSPYKTLIDAYEDEVPMTIADHMAYTSVLSTADYPICHDKSGALYLEFEINSQLPSSDYRLMLVNEKRLFIYGNLFSIQYLLSKILKSLKSSIDFQEISDYAAGEVSKYIQEGYMDQIISGDYQHFNIAAHMNFKGPALIIPQKVCDENNRDVLLISIGEIILDSNLPPRQNSNEDYKRITSADRMYDRYNVFSQGMQISTILNYDGKISSLAKLQKHDLIEKVNVTCHILNLIEPKNPYLDTAKISIVISKIQMNLKDSQIMYFIHFLDGMTTISERLQLVLGEDKQDEEIKQEIAIGKDKPLMTSIVPPAKIFDLSQAPRSQKTLNQLIGRKISQLLDDSGPTKNFFSFDLILSKVQFTIWKSLTTEEKYFSPEIEYKQFLNFVINNVKFKVDLNEKKDMKMNIQIYNIFLFDFDEKYSSNTTERLINREFQCILGSINSQEQEDMSKKFRSSVMCREAREDQVAQETQSVNANATTRSFVDIAYYHNASKNKTDIKVNFTKLLLCMNFSTMERFVKFGNYYYKIYLATIATREDCQDNLQGELEKLTDLKSKKTETIPKNRINQKFVLKWKEKIIARRKAKEAQKNALEAAVMIPVPKETHSFKPLEKLISFSCNNSPLTGTETYSKRERSKLSFSFEMKEIEMNFPVDPAKETTRVLVFNFNILIKMKMQKEYDSLFSTLTNRLMRVNYHNNNMSLNIMIFNVDFDIINFTESSFKKNLLSEKILSNFRMMTSLKSCLILERETSMTTIDVHMEPMNIMWGFRQIRVLSNVLSNVNEFMVNLWKPYDNPGEDVVISQLNECGNNHLLLKSNMMVKMEQMVKKIEKKQRDNISCFNNLTDVNFKLDKISLKLMDNTGFHEIPLLKLEANKISFKLIMNSDPADSENMANALVEMISGKDIDLKNFNTYNLYKYLEACFYVDIATYNEVLSDWEPLLEPWNGNLKINQVAKITRLKMILSSEVFLNLNLSYSSIKVFNTILKKLGENEALWQEEEQSYSENYRIGMDRNSSSIPQNDNVMALEFCNYTGTDVTFWLDCDKKSPYLLKTTEKKIFSKAELNQLFRRLTDSEIQMMKKDKFSFHIFNCTPIVSQDFSNNHYAFYKVPMPKIDNTMTTLPYFEIGIKIQNNGLIKTITFEANVGIYNNTQYPMLISVVKAKDFAEKYNSQVNEINFEDCDRVLVRPFKKKRIPIRWLIEKYMAFGSIQEERVLLYDDLRFSSLMHDEISGRELLKDPETEGFDETLNDLLMRRYTKIASFPNSEAPMHIAVDILVLKPSNERKIKEIVAYEDLIKKPRSTFSYVIIFNPPIVIENCIPYPVQFQYRILEGESPATRLSPLEQTPNYYVNYLDKLNAIKVNVQYLNDKVFRSEYYTFSEDCDHKKKVKLCDETGSDSLYISIKYEPSDKLVVYNQSFQKVVQNLSRSRRMAFYVEYLVVNKTDMKLYMKSPADRTHDQEIANMTHGTAFEHKVNLFHIPGEKMTIRNDISEWATPFSINTHGVDGVVSLQWKPEDSVITFKNVTSFYTDVAVIIKSSSYFIHSTILILEPRYLLINHLGVGIKFRQIDKNYNSLDVFEIKNNEKKAFIYANNPEKKHKKLIQFSLMSKTTEDANISLRTSMEISPAEWSEEMDVDEIDDFDVKIPVIFGCVSKPKLLKNIYTYDKATHFLLVRVNVFTEDNGLIFIEVTPPEFPQLYLINETPELLKIYQSEDDPKEAICIQPHSEGPFTWGDLRSKNKEAIVNVFNKKKKICFQKMGISHEEVNYQDKRIKVFYNVYLDNQNMTRILKIQSGEIPTQGIKAAQKLLIGKKIPIITKVIVSLQGVGLSLIDDIPRELIYISFYGIEVNYFNNIMKTGTSIENTQSCLLCCKNFQIDNCVSDDCYKTVIAPKNQIKPDKKNEEEEDISPFFQLFVSRQTIDSLQPEESVTKYQQIEILIDEFNVKLDHIFINSVLSLANSLILVVDFYKNDPVKPVMAGAFACSTKSDFGISSPIIQVKTEQVTEITDYEPMLVTDLVIPERNSKNDFFFIGLLRLAVLKLHLTIHVDIASLDIASIPKYVLRILGTLGNSLGRITGAPLCFDEMCNQNVFSDINRIISSLQAHYRQQGISQFYKILGSSDLLGNPIGLMDKIGTGFSEFFGQSKGRGGHVKLGARIGRGVKAISTGVVGGGFDSVGKLTGTLYTMAKSAQGEKVELKEEDEPQNVLTGAYEGVKGGATELGLGVAGIVIKPYNSAKAEGVKGFFKGVGKGLLGAAISPLTAVLKAGNSISVGMRNTVTNNIITERFRHPRIIVENEPLKPYDENMANIKAILLSLGNFNDNKIIFYSEFKYLYSGYDEKMSHVILTDKRIIVVYDSKEIAFNLEIKTIESVEVHLIDEEYVLLFLLEEKKKAYISTEDLALCSQLHGILKKLLT